MVHIHMEKTRGQKSYMGNFLINFLDIQSLSVLWFVAFHHCMLTTLCWLSLVMQLWHYTSMLKYCSKPTNYSYFSFIYISAVNNSLSHDLTIYYHWKEFWKGLTFFTYFSEITSKIYKLSFVKCTLNYLTVLPYVAMEQTVMYQERFAWMYSRWACPIAMELIELIINLIHKLTLIFILSILNWIPNILEPWLI